MHWVRRLFQKSSAEKHLDKELRFHLERLIADHVAAGLSADEARRRAQLEFRGLERVKEEVRDTQWETHFDNLLGDFRYAFRSLRKDRGFSLTAIFALALGIGSCTIVFSVVYSALFDALPYKHFGRSVVVKMHNLSGNSRDRTYFSPEEVRAFREQNHVFDDVIVYQGFRPSYDNGHFIRNFSFGMFVTPNTFDYLGVPPLLGRTISPEDGSPNAPPVFVMNYRLWQKEFAGDPKILNTTFILNGKPTTLVGIMPLQFNAFGTNFWEPFSPDQVGGSLMGRLRPGASVQTVAADLDAIAHRMHKANPGGIFPENKFAIVPETLLDSLIGDFRKTLYAVLDAVLLLLLISCSNVANLFFARATTRQREIAVRATLGATRSRLVRQLLVESAVLAFTASVAGCVLAYFALKVVVALIPAGTLPEETVIRMHMPVLFLSLVLTILTTIVCGLAPAVHVLRGELQPRLAGSGKATGGASGHGELRAALVVGEVAVSIVLLTGAGLLMRSFFVLTRVDLGFDPQNVVYFQLNLPPSYFFKWGDAASIKNSLEKKNALTRQLLARMQALPGVISASELNNLPPLTSETSDTIIPGKPHADRWETAIDECSEGYSKTLGLPLLRGRFLSVDDVSSARHVAVVNETFARRYFPNEDALGHKVKFGNLDLPFVETPHDIYFEIVGIVRDFKTRDYVDPSWQTVPQAFMPYSVAGYSWRSFMARSAVDPNLLLKNFLEELQDLDPGVEIAESGTLESSLHKFYRGPQFELVTVTSFAGIGLALLLIGIFGVMAYTVALRTHEIGVRVALGAQQTNILRLVLLNGFRLVAIGVLIGLLASCELTRFVASQISGVSPTDPLTFAGAVTVIVLVALAACLLPARRAAAVDPLVALRYE
ncbi:MAG TPA: ABC transporter permease [Candidatus Acidoferrum sp.]